MQRTQPRAAAETADPVSVQRLTEEQAKDAFDNAEIYADELKITSTPTGEVVEAIARLTTEWEQRDRALAWKRREAIKSELGGYIDSTADTAFKAKDPALLKPLFTSADHWAATLPLLFRQLERPTGPTPEQIRKVIERNRERKDVPLGERVWVECTMGQGVSGDLRQFIFSSDQFSTCSGVVMVNEQTGRGGLFHFGAGSKAQLTELGEMAKDVEPTWVGIENRPSFPQDYQVLNEFFSARGYRVGVVPSSNECTLYLDDHNRVKVETKAPATGPWLNVTGMASLSGELHGSGLVMYVNQSVYTRQFAI